MSHTITRILVPTDFSPPSEAALEYAAGIASTLGAAIHLLHVVDDPYLAGAMVPEYYIAAAPGMRATLIDEAATRLAALVPSVAARGGRATSEVRVGAPADAICSVARDLGSDLIVMGTHGRTGVAHLLMGSVAEKVVRRAPCPVLTVGQHAAAAKAAESGLFERDFVPTE